MLRDRGAEQTDHDALNGEFGGREEIGVAGIFRAKEGAAALGEKTFEGRFAVDEGGDDVTWTGFAWSEEDDVVFDDVGVDHGIAADAQGEEIGVGAETESRRVDGDGAFGFLFVGGGKAGWNHAIERDAKERGVAGMVAGMEEAAGFAGEAVERAFLREGIDVALDGEGAGEAEVFLDFAERRGDALFALRGLNKIEDLLLSFSEGFGHGVCT